MLGAPRDQFPDPFHALDPQGEPLNIPQLVPQLQQRQIRHVFLDSVGEALNAAGVNEDSDIEVGPWIGTGPRRIVDHGIGVTCIDHATKDDRNAPLHPSGSKRKRAMVTGANLLVVAVIPPTSTQDGRMKILCGKDRHGNLRQGDTVALCHFDHNRLDPTGPAASIQFRPPVDEAEEAEDRRVREVVRIVGQTPGVTKNGIVPLMSAAQRAKKLSAVDAAVARGLILLVHGPRTAENLFPSERDDEKF